MPAQSSSYSDRYVPPPLRSSHPTLSSSAPHPYLPSLGKNSLAAFDRSSVPDSEDSFYTFSNEPSFAFSHFSPAPSSPGSSRNLSKNFRLSPKGFVASPPPPRALHRLGRLPPSYKRQSAIDEVDEEDTTPPPLNEFGEAEEPFGPIMPLASFRQQADTIDLDQHPLSLNEHGAEDCSGCGLAPDASFVIFVSSVHIQLSLSS